MPRKPPAILSKSRYLSGLQCDKKLWVEVREPYLVPKPDLGTQATFDRGHEVGWLAQSLFPGGIEINPSNRIWASTTAATRKALAMGRPLFEPAFTSGGAGCRVDVLDPTGDGRWDLYEVKSGTSVKEPNPSDIALQAYVLAGAGIKVRDYFLLHLDREYVRRGPLDLEKLFRRENLNDLVEELLPAIGAKVAEMHRGLASERRPEVAIGPHCSRPYGCSLREICWNFLPERSVFNLRRDNGDKKAFELVERGILSLSEVPADFLLTFQQEIQVGAQQSGEARIVAPEIRRFLDSFEYPLYYFDLETSAPAVPRFDGTGPYRPQVPFQFSLHVVDSADSVPRPVSYLAEGSGDPRPDLLDRLREVGGDSGSVIVYNQSFEKTVLRAAALEFPDYDEWVEQFQARFIDLAKPFANFSYYHPDQQGSASLKAVLPTLTRLSYASMEVSDGEAASREFERVTYGDVDPAERLRVRKQLEQYCELDTRAMIEIVAALRVLVSSAPEL